jgi:hypothetical protein
MTRWFRPRRLPRFLWEPQSMGGRIYSFRWPISNQLGFKDQGRHSRKAATVKLVGKQSFRGLQGKVYFMLPFLVLKASVAVNVLNWATLKVAESRRSDEWSKNGQR